tara:strand:+ start:6110 stop:6421 length:312 start_codon:yes stop_codon:yes gene_type:complete
MGLMKKINQKLVELEAELEKCKKENDELIYENNELFASHEYIHSSIQENLAKKDKIIYVIEKVLLKHESYCLDNQKERKTLTNKLGKAIVELLILEDLNENKS